MANRKTKIPFSIDRLEYVLKEKGISHASICETVGCSKSNYKQWKRTSEITEKDLKTISERTHIDFDWLRGFDVRPKTKEPPKNGDYIRDTDGYIIPSNRKSTAYSVEKNNTYQNQKFEGWLDSVRIGINRVSKKKGGLTLAEYKDLEGDFDLLMVEVSEFIVNKLIEAKQTAPMTAEQLVKVYTLYSSDEIETLFKRLKKASLVDLTQAEADKIIATRKEGK